METYIKRFNSYKHYNCIMQYIISTNNDFHDIELLLSEFNDDKFIIGEYKYIIGKKVLQFKYNDRNGDIMPYLDKYIIITYYPIIF